MAAAYYKVLLVLTALAACWLLFVTFPSQIHERYILYPAMVSIPLITLGLGWGIVHIAIAMIAVLPVLQGMLSGGNRAQWLAAEMGAGFGAKAFQNIAATHPGIGWALITIALVCLWKAMDLRRPARNEVTARARSIPPQAAPGAA